MIKILNLFTVLTIFQLNIHLADFAPPVEGSTNNNSGLSILSIISSIKNGIIHVTHASYKVPETIKSWISNGLTEIGYENEVSKQDILVYNSEGKVLIEINEDETKRNGKATDEESPPDCDIPPYPNDIVTPAPMVDADDTDDFYFGDSKTKSSVEDNTRDPEDAVKRSEIDGKIMENLNEYNEENNEKPDKDVKVIKDETPEEKRDVMTKQISEKRDPEQMNATKNNGTPEEEKKIELPLVTERKSELSEEKRIISNLPPNKETKNDGKPLIEENNPKKVVQEENKAEQSEINTNYQENEQVPNIKGKAKEMNKVDESEKQLENVTEKSKLIIKDVKLNAREIDIPFNTENARKTNEETLEDKHREQGKNVTFAKTEQENKNVNEIKTQYEHGDMVDSLKNDGPIESNPEIVEQNEQKEMPNAREIVNLGEETIFKNQSKETVEVGLSEKSENLNSKTGGPDTEKISFGDQNILKNIKEIVDKIESLSPIDIAENVKSGEENKVEDSFEESTEEKENSLNESETKVKKNKKEGKSKKVKNKLTANDIKIVKEKNSESGEEKTTISGEQEMINSLNKLHLDPETIKAYFKMLKKESDFKKKNKEREPEEIKIREILEKIGELKEDKKKKDKKMKSLKRKEDL